MKRSKPILSSSASPVLLLSFLYLIPFISQDLNLISSNKRIASATITHQYSSSSNNNNSTQLLANNNNNQTTNSQEFLLNLVKNSYKTGANANNNATSQSSYSSASSSPSLSSAASAATQSTPNRPLPQSRQAQPMHYQTTYACEGNQLDFGCQEGKMIHLVRAIYGRFSLSICNEQGYSNYSVDCASFKAFLLMETRCNKLNNCSVTVSEELFGDPCQGTSKYLEVQYYCYDANNQSPHQQVPNHRTSQLVVPSHLSNFAAQPPIKQPNSNSNSNNNYPQATPLSPSNNNDIGHKSQLPSDASVSDSSYSSSPSLNSVGGPNERHQQQHQQPSDDYYSKVAYPSVNSASADQAAYFCPPQTSGRNLHWNYTRAGRLAKQSCPDGSIGEVSWLCDANRLRFTPQWSPDFSKCRLSWLERLSQQLDRMLESPGKQQQSAPEATRSQNEQILKQVLTDLTIMADTKELFSEDLERIDIMISQILAQFRSLSVVFGSLDSWRSPVLQGGIRANNFAYLYEDLFKKLVSIVSNLFSGSQRSAWLEIKQTSERQRLEQRFLSHLKEAGLLMANVFGSSLANYQLEPIRKPNVFAGFAVINNNNNNNNNGGLEFSSSELSSNSLTTSEDNNELRVQLRQTQSSNLNSNSNNNNNRFTSQLDEDDQPTLSEFRVHLSVLRELTAKGIARLLVIDVRKPNYSLMKQQLESAYASSSSSSSSSAVNQPDLIDPNNSWLSVLDGSQLWTTRVFGVFAIVGENGDILDGQQQQQPHRTFNDLLAQWPISVDFRSSALQVASVVPGQPAVYQSQVAKACSALDLSISGGQAAFGSEESAANQQPPCKTYKVNATSHICRCSRFGFVSLISYATQQQQQQPSTTQVQDILLQQWPTNQLGAADSAAGGEQQTSYIGAQDKLGHQQQSVGTWTAIFIALGLFLLIIFVTAFLINAFIRASSQSRLNKKPGGFFSAATGFGQSHRHDLSGGPTTGPLVDHSLVGGGGGGGSGGPGSDSLTGNNGGTTQSGSIIGLTQSAYQGYKTHQQSALYAAHLPAMGMCHRGHRSASDTSRWLQWAGLLNPTRWFGWRSKDDQMIQHHRVIGSSLSSSCKTTPNSMSHKSTYQNGYTTAGIHHHHASVVNALAAAGAAPSSSTSSYVSSSAYYEEIGPGNLTKVNTNHTNNPQRTQTLIDPFKRTPVDQQHQQVIGQQATLWIQQQPNSYPLDQSNYGPSLQHQQQQQQQQQHQMSMLPVINGFQQQQLQSSKQIQINDLNQLHQQHQQMPSSAGSGGSQHSSSSTPRHYLFASPTAVNAYKNSMSQQQQQATTLNHHHHCQQMQFKTSTSNTNQPDHRFMPS